jgi:hypothetical protein
LWKYEGLSPYDVSDRSAQHRDRTTSDANWIFYRLAEIYLMKAEAYTELDNFSNALTELNRVRRRAGIEEYTDASNKLSLLNEIVTERAREFVGEGKRYFDLVRISRRDIDRRLPIISQAVIFNVDAKSRSAVATKLKDVDSWFLPIYYEELVYNKKLKQNPFYE